jgi:multimeric flavodoxin WrbA
MKILGVLGSPRKEGNSDVLLSHALSVLKDKGQKTEKIILNDLKIKPCQECGGCANTGICVVKDDFMALCDKVMKCDGLVLAGPIFFGGLSAQTKIFIDRFQCVWVRKYVLKNIFSRKNVSGIFICVGGMKQTRFFEAARVSVKAFMAVTGFEYSGEIFFEGIDKKGEILNKNKDALIRVEDLISSVFRIAGS